MQRIRVDGRRLIYNIYPILLFVAFILIDQITKTYFVVRLAGGEVWSSGKERITIIENFFYFSYTYNTGAAWSFLSDASWAQIFFKVLTAVALVAFFFFYVYAHKRGYEWLKVSMIFIMGGTVGNFIDRVAYGCVVDFISFVFGSYRFPIFNMADVFMTVGVIMLLVHYLFLDHNALFGKNGKDKAVDS